MVISGNLLDEIDEKKKKILGDPKLNLRLRKKIDNGLRHFCDVHSYFLEHPDERMEILRKQGTKDYSTLKKKVKGYIERVGGAWEGLSLKYPNGLLPNLSPNVIMDIARYVDEDNWSYRGSGIITLPGMRFTPPNALKVPNLVDEFCYQMNESELHPVEAAATAHLVLTGIQAFKDGNKRVSRLIQDKILFDNGLPHAPIPYAEREVYLDVLDYALLARFNDGAARVSEQRPFFDYVGGKVNGVLDDVIGDLR